jgi:hypothetical protein
MLSNSAPRQPRCASASFAMVNRMMSSIEVVSASFPVVRFRSGYEQVEVVAFIGQIVKALAAYESDAAASPRLTSAEVKARSFQATKFREGYDKDSVNTIMMLAAASLEKHEMAQLPKAGAAESGTAESSVAAEPDKAEPGTAAEPEKAGPGMAAEPGTAAEPEKAAE